MRGADGAIEDACLRAESWRGRTDERSQPIDFGLRRSHALDVDFDFLFQLAHAFGTTVERTFVASRSLLIWRDEIDGAEASPLRRSCYC
jgi:hypothetical protein